MFQSKITLFAFRRVMIGPYEKYESIDCFFVLIAAANLHVVYENVSRLENPCIKCRCQKLTMYCHCCFQIREGLNESFTPCENVWQWACGGWLSENKLPRGKSVWDQKQQLLQEG